MVDCLGNSFSSPKQQNPIGKHSLTKGSNVSEFPMPYVSTELNGQVAFVTGPPQAWGGDLLRCGLLRG